jgi:Spy/CpxP family protein refolding chaperone
MAILAGALTMCATLLSMQVQAADKPNIVFIWGAA